MTTPEHWVVLKFGGTSVGDPENWPTIAAALRECRTEGARPFVVCSALSGVSNLLEQLLAAADAGEPWEPFLRDLRTRHREFGAALELESGPLVETYCRQIDGLLRKPRPSPRVPPPVRALVMAVGELLSSRLGAEWLKTQGVPVAWKDARDLLRGNPPPEGTSEHQRFLSATCSYERDERIDRSLSSTPAGSAVVTQGFIARDLQGRTILLGRGGSDTAAAYFAAKLAARRLEVWTDVPGVFTANPQQIPQARLLQALSYDEAETLAGMGAKVLHPRCIQPLREAGIPLHVRWTARPEVSGTVIGPPARSARRGIKAVSARTGLCLLSMEKRAGWQPVGFMADVAACFKRHALSIDLLSSSPWTIQATLDPAACTGITDDLPRLLDDLQAVCDPTVRRDVASVSLVGHGMRNTLHRMGPLLELLHERELLMLSPSAHDLTFSFVVPRKERDPLLRTLHAELFEDADHGFPFGPTWEELTDESAEHAPAEGFTAEAVGGWSR